MSTGFAMIAAVDESRGIGRAGDLPWRIPDDMAHFRSVTRHAPSGGENAVVMGRVTWESIPEKFRPLAGRINVVLSRRELDLPAGVECATSLPAALSAARRRRAERVFIIGGAALYAEGLEHPECEVLYLTRVSGEHQCDVHFPDWTKRFRLANSLGQGESGGHHYSFEVWERA